MHYRTTPSGWKAKTAVIVDTAAILFQRNTVQVFPNSDATWESRIESEPIMEPIDLHEPELYLEVQELRTGLCVNYLSHYGRAGRVGGNNTQVVEIAPSLGARKKRPDKFHWRVDYTRRATDMIHDRTFTSTSTSVDTVS